MAALRMNGRLQVGSSPWIAEERNTALNLTENEAEEFSFSVRNEVDWLNEHMAEIFNKNELSVTELFKTPGKLRGKTPRTALKRNPLEARAPLSDVFSATPLRAQNLFKQTTNERFKPTFKVTEDSSVPATVKFAANTGAFSNGPDKENFDSGYHGSQGVDIFDVVESTLTRPITRTSLARPENPNQSDKIAGEVQKEPLRSPTTEDSYHSAKEGQTEKAPMETLGIEVDSTTPITSPDLQRIMSFGEANQPSQPTQAVLQLTEKSLPAIPLDVADSDEQELPTATDQNKEDDIQSNSDDSSPMRTIVRKSSLNFPSLPAREPLTTKKSIGNRTSRTSHLEQSTSSYFGRQTGSKSIGSGRLEDQENHDNFDLMEIDVNDKSDGKNDESDVDKKNTRLHNKTSTQRLQDQISRLGQTQTTTSRASKSIPNNVGLVAPLLLQATSQPIAADTTSQQHRPLVTPGAFPEDEDDDWIGPATLHQEDPMVFSPRPPMVKSHTTDIMQGIEKSAEISASELNILKQRRNDVGSRSPIREAIIPERTANPSGHAKSASTSVLRSLAKTNEAENSLGKKGISVSNPDVPSSHVEKPTTTPKSPSRFLKDSPIKTAKDKLSSILKSSRGLFVSSGAALAEGHKARSAGPPKMGKLTTPSMESLSQVQQLESASLYPTISTLPEADEPISTQADSPSKKANARQTRASTERKEKEAREAQRRFEHDERLERAREKERDKARVFSKEKEKVAAMEKQVAAQKEIEKKAVSSQVELPQPTRTSPRKTKTQLEAEGRAAAALPFTESGENEIEMIDAPSSMPPPAARPTTANKSKEPPKRPMRPTKDPLAKSKQAPVIIRVNTGSQQPGQYHPSNSTLTASLSDSLASSAAPPAPLAGSLKSKASSSSLHSKASSTLNRSVSSTTGKPKALEAAARKREQDEREAQRKRDAKAEIERKRAAIHEEEKKQEQQRRREAERQKEKEREQLAAQNEAKKVAQRQALEKKRMEIEKAKQQRAPPPAPRNNNNDVPRGLEQERAVQQSQPQRADHGPPRPASRVATAINRADETSKATNQPLQNTTKAPPKRPLQQDGPDENQSRPALQRNGPSYQQIDGKRRRTDEEWDEDVAMSQPPKSMAPPIRQSNIRQKDVPAKGLFPNGYTNAPQQYIAPSLHKATLQHMHGQSKPAHPMDMAQNSKAPITFAPAPGPSQPTAQQQQQPSHKTPARPADHHGNSNNGGKSAGKSAARSSPRFPANGDSIELPEIHTDSEEEEDDDYGSGSEAGGGGGGGSRGGFVVPDWANSPAIRAQLAAQDSMDPAAVFGPIAPLHMEEIFRGNKERWGKFRARTSSANWSGQDGLTEEEIRRDLQARERMRRDGGWTYGVS